MYPPCRPCPTLPTIGGMYCNRPIAPRAVQLGYCDSLLVYPAAYDCNGVVTNPNLPMLLSKRSICCCVSKNMNYEIKICIKL